MESAFSVLPESLIIYFFHNWLDLLDLVAFDSAYTSRGSRGTFLEYLQTPYYQHDHRCLCDSSHGYGKDHVNHNCGVTSLAHYEISCHKSSGYLALQWIQSRNLAVKSVVLDVEARDFLVFDAKEKYSQFTFVTEVHWYVCQGSHHAQESQVYDFSSLYYHFPNLQRLELWENVVEANLVQIVSNAPADLVIGIHGFMGSLSLESLKRLFDRLGEKISCCTCIHMNVLDLLIKHSPALRELEHYPDKVPMQQFIEATVHFPKLEILTFLESRRESMLSCIPLHEIQMIQLASQLSNLTHCYASEQPFKLAVYLINHCPRIEVICVDSVIWIKSKSMNKEKEMHGSILKFSRLDLTLREDVQYFLSKVPPVTEIIQVPLCDEAGHILCSLLGKYTLGVTYMLIYYKTLVVEATFLPTIFKAFPSLSELSIDNGSCGDSVHLCRLYADDSIPIIDSICEHGKNLKGLALSNISIIDTENVATLVMALPNLVKLNFHCMHNVLGNRKLFYALLGRVWEEITIIDSSIGLGNLKCAVINKELLVKKIGYYRRTSDTYSALSLGYGRQVLTAEYMSKVASEAEEVSSHQSQSQSQESVQTNLGGEEIIYNEEEEE